MAFKNVTPMALATSAVREWCHRLLTPEVTKKDVLSYMKPSEKFNAERVLDRNVSEFRMLQPPNTRMLILAQLGDDRLMMPGYWFLTEANAENICRSFAKETHFDDCKRDVRRWISQEVSKK